MYYSTFYALQIIIPSYQVVALIINIPCVMITEVDGTTGECREFGGKYDGLATALISSGRSFLLCNKPADK